MGVTILEHDGFLEVAYDPEPVTPRDLEEQRTLVAQTTARTGVTHVLVDASALEALPPLGAMLLHNVAVSSDDQLQRARFAVVCAVYDDDAVFLEISGANRGVHMKCFASREEALVWLGC